MLSFLKKKARFRQCKLLTFANLSLRDLSLLNSLVLSSFLNLSKKLIINCLVNNASKIEDANKKTRLKMLENASLFR